MVLKDGELNLRSQGWQRPFHHLGCTKTTRCSPRFQKRTQNRATPKFGGFPSISLQNHSNKFEPSKHDIYRRRHCKKNSSMGQPLYPGEPPQGFHPQVRTSRNCSRRLGSSSPRGSDRKSCRRSPRVRRTSPGPMWAGHGRRGSPGWVVSESWGLV